MSRMGKPSDLPASVHSAVHRSFEEERRRKPIPQPKSARKAILGGAEVIDKMDELENAEQQKATVADYELIWTKLRNWLEANSA